MTRAEILQFRDALYGFEPFGLNRKKVDDLIYCALRGQDLDAEIAKRSADVAADPTAIPLHAPGV